MDRERLTDKAQQVIDERGGVESITENAGERDRVSEGDGSAGAPAPRPDPDVADVQDPDKAPEQL